ncbi:Uncharacterised protein [uncultured archaeon]|nr:Uncharacterised protein [uncultured archaeon]
MKTNKIILTLLALISLSITTNNLIILKKYTPIGYKIDLYSQLPPTFWYGLLIVYFICCILILTEWKKFKIVGIITLFINYCLLFYIPYAFGYYVLGRDDEISHLGEINNIILTGNFDPSDIYPATHIIFSSTSMISGIPPNILSIILPLVFSIIFVYGIFIFSKLYINNTKIMHIIIPCSFIYYLGHFHFSIVPNYLFFILIPLILFILSKYLTLKTFSYSFILMLFVLILPFGHPFIFIYLFLIFIFLELYMLIKGKHKKILNMILISICTFITWFIYNRYYLSSFRAVYHSFKNSITMSVMAETLEKTSKIQLEMIEFIRLIFFYYGRYIIPLLFITILLIYILIRRIQLNKNERKTIYLLTVSIIISGLFEGFLTFNPFISHSPDRISNLNFTVFPMIPLFAISIYELILKKIKTPIGTIISSIILTLVFTASMYGAFYSPIIYHPNIATTSNEIYGMNWLFINKDEKPIYDLQGSIGYRFSDLLFGWSETKRRFNKDIKFSNEGNLRNHFGYDKNDFFDEHNKYIVLTTIGEELYQTVYKKVERYNASDFKKFRKDPNVNKIYDSLNIEIYKS